VSANLEWTIPFTIQSSKGDLALNDDSGSALYLLLQDGCLMTRDLRVTTDEIPQGDGQINHARFTGGYRVQLEIALWESREMPACDQAAREMAEELMRHLNVMLNDAGRLFWTPTGLGDQRMLDEARLAAVTPFTFGPVGDARITVTFDSPFPYVLDFTQETISLVDGVPQAVTNEGTADFYPVVKVYGPTSSFTLENTTLGEQIVYDSSLPGGASIGAADYVEFDFFRNTAYLNGSGASRKSGIDIELSDFWILEAGVANTIEITGADADLLLNHAYA
jgi:hypothetical protein